MNDLIRGFRFIGDVHFHGINIYDSKYRPCVGAPEYRHGVPAAQPLFDVDL